MSYGQLKVAHMFNYCKCKCIIKALVTKLQTTLLVKLITNRIVGYNTIHATTLSIKFNVVRIMTELLN